MGCDWPRGRKYEEGCTKPPWPGMTGKLVIAARSDGQCWLAVSWHAQPRFSKMVVQAACGLWTGPYRLHGTLRQGKNGREALNSPEYVVR